MNENELDYDIVVCCQCKVCKHLEECFKADRQRVLHNIYVNGCRFCTYDCCSGFEYGMTLRELDDDELQKARDELQKARQEYLTQVESLDDDDLPF